VPERPDSDQEQHASLGRATLHGVLWMTAGRFLKAPTNLIAVAILARILTPADFGVVAIGFVVTALATMLVDGTFGMVLVQRRTIDPPLIGASLLLSAGLGSIFGIALILSGPLVQNYFDFPQLSGVLRLLAIVLPVSAAMAVTTALLQRASRFGVLTINSFIAQLVNAIVAVAMAFMGFGVWSLVWSQLAQVVVETLLGYWAVRPRYTIGFSIAAVGDAMRSGGMFTVSKLFNWASGNIDKVVIGRLLGAAPLGLYSRANTLMATANQLVGTGTARVLFSTFARMQHDLKRMERAFDRALSTSVVGASLASAFVIIFADPIVRVLLGPQWLDTVPVLQALFAAFITRSGYVVAEAVPLALGLARISAYRQAAQFFLVIAGAWIGSRFGVDGAAIGIAIAYWIFYLLCLVLVQQLLVVRTSRLLHIHLKGVVVAAPAVIVTLALRALLNPGGNLILEALLAIVFGIVSALVIAFGPESLLSEDIVRMRGHFVRFTRNRLRLLAGTQ
jgi:PST family polysaccharide transporter